MLDHISLHVTDYQKAKAFYLAALAPLKYEVIAEYENACGLGADGRPYFWIKGDGARGAQHFAFVTPNKKTVDDFYSLALHAGGKDNGTPGIRERPWGNRYAAFVFDPEGNNVEVVCHNVDELLT